jgi:L,D-peptidoglycan transpeptidase YkuD (ErfK/YbiS/YcfS/YnhG family)
LHRSNDWTDGCIALTNEQLEELLHYVEVGTKVVISE